MTIRIRDVDPKNSPTGAAPPAVETASKLPVSDSDTNVIPFPAGSEVGSEAQPQSAGDKPGDDFSTRESPSDEGELNLRIVRPLVAYLRDKYGSDVLIDVGREAGLSLQDLEAEDFWLSHERCETLLQSARSRLASDQEFIRACQHDLTRQYGPLSLLLRLTSLRTAFEQLDRTRKMVSRISRFRTKRSTIPNVLHMSYASERRESRLMCLSRQAQWRALPEALWGLPPALVEEESCIGWGDDCCRYTIRWREPFRWKPALLGAVLGGVAGAGMFMASLSVWFVPVLLATGLLAGLMFAYRSVQADKQRFSEARAQEVERFVDQHLQASAALLELHHRQQQWAGQLEAQIKERTAALESVVTQLRQLRQKDHSNLRDISHDLRNPLTAISGNASMVRHMIRKGRATEELIGPVADIEEAGEQLTRMLLDLAERARTGIDEAASQPRAELVNMDDFVEHCRRQLQALVLGRDLRISAFRIRQAPMSIHTDRLLLDRIMDNLMTNAAKYTERGSIVVEISGNDEALCLKLSDTGRGMHAQQLESVFHGTQPDARPLVGSSSGIGLSVTIRLVSRIGGRLEVMSRPNIGTTFWLFVPIYPPERDAPTVEESLAEVIERVLVVRPIHDD